MSTISVVIPSAGGADLWRALESVEAQTSPVDEKIIVLNNIDLTEAGELSARLRQSGCTPVIAETGGACEARDLGVEHATTDYIAFLDADDVWRPEKIERSLEELSTGKQLVSSRVQYFNEASGDPVAVAPVEPYQAGTSLGQWLFVNRRLSPKRNVLHTSSLVISTVLAKKLRWVFGDPHEDWSFLLQAEQQAGTKDFAQLGEVLVDVSMGSGRSLSAGIGWESSFAWLNQHRSFLNDHAYADFLAGQVMRYVLTSPGSAGSSKVIREVARNWRTVSLRAVALGASGLVGRQRFEKIVASARS